MHVADPRRHWAHCSLPPLLLVVLVLLLVLLVLLQLWQLWPMWQLWKCHRQCVSRLVGRRTLLRASRPASR
jgi:hypothetical protein